MKFNLKAMDFVKSSRRAAKGNVGFSLPLIIFLYSILAGVLPLMALAQGEKARDRGVISLQLENDIFAGTDQYYTNGIRLSWVSADLAADKAGSRLPGWLHSLGKRSPFIRPGSQNRISIFFGQNIYTPYDIERSDLIEDDRPYAGLSYVGIGFHSRSTHVMDTLEFELGIVGPSSLAEQSQKLIHNIFNFTHPNGWDNQLHNELALEAVFEHRWKLLDWRKGGGFGWDLISNLGAGLGNVYIGSAVGMEARCGLNLPDDFGTFHFRANSRRETASASGKQDSSLSPKNRFGIHFRLAVKGEAVLRDIFLDGNTFGTSHSVEKRILIANVIAGVTVISGRFRISYNYVYSTKRFKTQEKEQIFGQINLSFYY